MTEILIVDDSDATGRTLEYLLKKRGYDVLIAETGEDALRSLSQRSVDLIITDLKTPALDGRELVESLRRHKSYSSIPILAMSADSGTADIQSVLRAGATGFLPKPITPHQLLSEVETLCKIDSRR